LLDGEALEQDEALAVEEVGAQFGETGGEVGEGEVVLHLSGCPVPV
jgi:hypothetical protein